MRAAFILLVAWVALGCLALAVEAKRGFETASINIGYMSQDDSGARVGVPELADYIKKLQATCTEFFADAATPENLDVVIAVRVGQESRVWFLSSLASSDYAALRAKLEAVTPPKLSGGPIAFAIQARIAGGAPQVAPQSGASTPTENVYTPGGSAPQTTSDPSATAPVPREWKDAIQKQGRTLKLDELIPLVWPGTTVSAAAPGDGFKVPPGIRYHSASAEKNEQAKQLLTEKFTADAKDADVLLLFNKVICGPGLWAEMKNNPAMAKLTKGTVNINEGSLKLEGKLFQSPEEVLAFWSVFKQRTDFTGLTVRKLNQKELKTYWAMISFDIEEPIFILDSPKHKILVQFTQDGKILWIDDYQNFPAHS